MRASTHIGFYCLPSALLPFGCHILSLTLASAGSILKCTYTLWHTNKTHAHIQTHIRTHMHTGRKTPPKWQKNDLVSGGHGPAWPSWELAWTMYWVDQLRTSADKRMWSGRCAVVMRTGRRAELLGVKLGCPRSRCRAVVLDVLCVR